MPRQKVDAMLPRRRSGYAASVPPAPATFLRCDMASAGALFVERAVGYSVRIERIGRGGAPEGNAALYEADSEIEAVTIAAYEVDIGRSGPQRIATVFDAAGKFVLAYTGRAREEARAE